MRVLVCGSRTFSAPERVFAVLDAYHAAYNITVIEGGARGADRYAAEWATEYRIDDHEQYPALWELHGKRAGYLRNQQMLEEGKPDVVWAFVDKPLAQSRGTVDMVRRAQSAGIPTYVVTC